MKSLIGSLISVLLFYSSISSATMINSFAVLEKEFKNGSVINIVLDLKMCKLISDRDNIDKKLLLSESTLLSFSSTGGVITDDKNNSRTMITNYEDTSFEINGEKIIVTTLKKTLMINSELIVKFILRTDQSKTPAIYSCEWSSLNFGFR